MDWLNKNLESPDNWTISYKYESNKKYVYGDIRSNGLYYYNRYNLFGKPLDEISYSVARGVKADGNSEGSRRDPVFQRGNKPYPENVNRLEFLSGHNRNRLSFTAVPAGPRENKITALISLTPCVESFGSDTCLTGEVMSYPTSMYNILLEFTCPADKDLGSFTPEDLQLQSHEVRANGKKWHEEIIALDPMTEKEGPLSPVMADSDTTIYWCKNDTKINKIYSSYIQLDQKDAAVVLDNDNNVCLVTDNVATNKTEVFNLKTGEKVQETPHKFTAPIITGPCPQNHDQYCNFDLRNSSTLRERPWLTTSSPVTTSGFAATDSDYSTTDGGNFTTPGSDGGNETSSGPSSGAIAGICVGVAAAGAIAGACYVGRKIYQKMSASSQPGLDTAENGEVGADNEQRGVLSDCYSSLLCTRDINEREDGDAATTIEMNPLQQPPVTLVERPAAATSKQGAGKLAQFRQWAIVRLLSSSSQKEGDMEQCKPLVVDGWGGNEPGIKMLCPPRTTVGRHKREFPEKYLSNGIGFDCDQDRR